MAQVIVVAYDPAWPVIFAQLKSRIWPHIQDLATSIEHVGSTSVPALAAKPIIDMTIIVPHASVMQTLVGRLASIGYQHRGNLGVPGREAFARPEGTPDHHLYVCVNGTEAMRNHLAVRAYLRSNPVAVKAYAALKKQLAARFPDDIDGYIEGKTQFILNILAQSGFSPEQISRIQTINSRPNLAKKLPLTTNFTQRCDAEVQQEAKDQDTDNQKTGESA